ncbi:hypothetical protein [Nonomuraea sp. NPDC002799]
MPKLKSVIAGLAISTAMAGGMVSMGAAASAATPVSTGNFVFTNDDWGWGNNNNHHHRRHHRCGRGHHGGGGWGGWGGGWGRHRRGGGTICVVVHNDNHNDNRPTHTTSRW